MLGIDPENSYLVNVYQKECKSWTYGLIPVTVAIGPTFSRGKAASGPKGKVFRGGSKAERDSWYGNNDKDFQKWWHREGKRDFNDGHDIQDAENAREAAKYWNDIGKPVPK
jgi:hypothetical protein